MALKKFLAVSAAVAALFGATSAHALVAVTLDPQANNGGLGTVDPTEAAFNATGFLGSLASTLIISGTSGNQTVVETGRIAVSDFQLNNANLNTNVANKYNIFADFTLTGAGSWASPGVFVGSPIGVALTVTLGADTNMDGIVDFVLGTGSLNAAKPVVASAFTFGDGTGLTTFTATIDFTPTVGTTGVGGFFRAPVPFSVDIAAGNVGGNTTDTTYVVNPDGSVTLTTIGGSGNFDFVQKVPEPSALFLAGLGLFAAGAAARRRKQAVDA